MRGLFARILFGLTAALLVFGLLAVAASADTGSPRAPIITASAASPDDGGIPEP